MKSLSSLVCTLQKCLHDSLVQVTSCFCRDRSLGIVVPDAADELGIILFRYFCLLAMLGDIA